MKIDFNVEEQSALSSALKALVNKHCYNKQEILFINRITGVYRMPIIVLNVNTDYCLFKYNHSTQIPRLTLD